MLAHMRMHPLQKLARLSLQRGRADGHSNLVRFPVVSRAYASEPEHDLVSYTILRDRFNRMRYKVEMNDHITRKEIVTEMRNSLRLVEALSEVEQNEGRRAAEEDKKKRRSGFMSLLGFCGLYGLFLAYTSGDGQLGEFMKDNWEEFDSSGRRIKRTSRTEAFVQLLGIESSQEKGGNKLDTVGKAVTLADVKGNEEAKEDLEDIVAYLKNPYKFISKGAELPKGVLMVGPPGTGKTLLARALAGEAGVPYIVVSGSSFEQMLVGVGSSRVRRMFARARQLSPCIIFIDEIDAVAPKRSGKSMMDHHETLNQLLCEMDGYSTDNGVVVLAATNMPEKLDPAILRAGRFDRKVTTQLPTRPERRDMLELYLGSQHGLNDSQLDALASLIVGLSGADIKNLVNLTHIEAIKADKEVTFQGLCDTVEIVRVGRARRGMQQHGQQLELTAMHEAGHAIVGLFSQGGAEVLGATIIPRGQALGYVTSLPDEDKEYTQKSLLARLDVAMGGRAAESIIYGEENVTPGASNDFMQATQLASRMVLHFGMSPLGAVYYSPEDMSTLSGETRDVLDGEIQKLLDASYARSKALLKKHSKEHLALAQALLDRETLSASEILEVVGLPEQEKTPARPLHKMAGGMQQTIVARVTETAAISAAAAAVDAAAVTEPAVV